MVSESSLVSPEPAEQPELVREQLYCALTGVPVRADEAYWAPPLITAGELLRTLFTTLLRSPGSLGYVLLGEQPNVPYAPAARQQLAARRSAEQLKLLVGLLLLAALLIMPIVWLALS